jgi:hypothetical protein
MMEVVEISETLVFSATLTWLVTRENFKAFIRYASLKYHIHACRYQQ